MESSGREPEMALLCDESLPSQAAFEAASPAMQSFGRLLARAARHTVPVLLVGERGTGKTTFARALHAMSSRAARPFVRVDGPSASGDLSAQARAARGGTLFLDEVTELPPPVQKAALRLLEDSGPMPFCVVASTRDDLEAEMSAGRFRRDLYYRLSVLEIRVPSLRERSSDILPIARAFVASVARREGRQPPEVSPALELALLRYAWPGNVQELLSVLERLLIVSTGFLDPTALPARISG